MKDSAKQRKHYNEKYKSVTPEFLAGKVNLIMQNFEEVILTYSSYYGMYYNDFSNQIVGKNILEIGCGDGINALLIAKLGAKSVLATDIASVHGESIRNAAKILKLDNLNFISGEIDSIGLKNNSYDIVIGKAVLHHLDHETEDKYLSIISRVCKEDGFARIVEGAQNSELLEFFRLLVPIGGRPSILNKNKYIKWKLTDPHPVRNNSSKHFIDIGNKYFKKVEFIPYGSIERFERLILNFPLNEKFRRLAHRLDNKLPFLLRKNFARNQLLNFYYPKD